MKTLTTLGLILIALQVSAYDYCAKFEDNAHELKVRQLSERLAYEWEEFCDHPRIMDVQHEIRRYYYQDTDQFEDHNVYTLHYNEYSCEYHYNVGRKNWFKEKDYCYNTW